MNRLIAWFKRWQNDRRYRRTLKDVRKKNPFIYW